MISGFILLALASVLFARAKAQAEIDTAWSKSMCAVLTVAAFGLGSWGLVRMFLWFW
ncbi:hypothetical protein D3C86_1169430 [compost metagenome]